MNPRNQELPAPAESELGSQLALIAAAAVVYGLYLGSFAVDAVRERGSAGIVVASVLVVLAPFIVRAGQRSLRARFERLPQRAVAALALLQVLPFLFLPPRAEALVPAVLVLLQGHLLLGARNTRLASASAVLGPLFILIEMALAPARIWLFGFALSVVLTLVAALFLNARENRRWIVGRWILRRTRPGVSSAALQPPLGGRPAALRTTIYGVLVGLLLLVLLPFLYLPLLLLPEPALSTASAAATQSEVEPVPDRAPGPPGAGQDARDAYQQIFPGGVNFGGGVAPVLAEVVMEVTPVPERPGGDPVDRGPLYLRGMVLDTILDHGVAVSGESEPVEITDGADGRSDGWVELLATAPAFELDIQQQPIRVRDGSWFVLFGPHPLAGVELPRVRYDPDGLLIDPAGEQVRLDYRVRVGTSDRPPPQALQTAGARYLQLPPGSDALDLVGELAREVTRGATDDRERVARVLAYFHRNFEYSLKSSEFPGLRGVVDFLARRSGHCSYYAAAATLLLRSLGIPTRIATGFLASDWQEDHYVVTTKNGHAWIEVAFEGVGWVPLDPTPADRRAAAFAALEGGREQGLGQLVGELYYDFERWISTGDQAFMKDFADAVLGLPAALWTSLRRSPWLIGAGLVVLALALSWRRLRPRVLRPARRAQGAAGPETDLYAHLLSALARHGFRKPPAQTPREFARLVVASKSQVLEPVVVWTERFYRARFGGEGFAEEERGDLRRYIDELRRVAALSPRP